MVLYNRLRENPNLDMAPRTFFFSGKAAPAYQLAKVIIKFINNLAGTIDGDPAIRGRLKVLFLPDYCVSLAERLIPASDVSNQISTAGYEASGTSNMKFMMNGALTIGTRDGATIEMAEEAGEENFFLFGLTAEQVAASRGWYSPQWHYDNEPETRAALDLIFSDHFSRNEPGVFAPLRDALLTHGDYYMHLADLKSYLEADQRLCELYADSDGWARKAILNVAGSGKFSSDRTIAEYAADIWKVEAVSGGVKQWQKMRHLACEHIDLGFRCQECRENFPLDPRPSSLARFGFSFGLIIEKEQPMAISPLAGKPADPSLADQRARLVTAYYTGRPDPSVPAQRVVFGTSGHRGSALDNAFNEAHILAITQAICLYRKQQSIDGPLYIGIDTHALSEPAFASALEVLAANGVDVMVDADNGYTPTPVISHAILTYNRGRKRGLADGIVITPSHNPPRFGGFKYDPPHGGPADTHVTEWIERQANAFIADGLRGVARVPFERARSASTVHPHQYLDSYVRDLPSVVDLQAIRESKVRIGVDPLGGASVAYWDAIGDRYGLNLEVVNHVIDPTFRFMTVDWDGQIRMDPSSVYAMARMVGLKERFDVAFASDTDADRHGIVSRSHGLLDPNHYLSVAISYLFANRPQWSQTVAVGKTVVSSSMIDRVVNKLGRQLVEVPVGFKWFVEGLIDGSLGFGGEESSGATFLRRDGTVWTTDKDGLVPEPASCGDHRAHREGPGRALSRTDSGVRHAILHTHRRAGDAGAEGEARKTIARGGCDREARWRADHSQTDCGPR